MRLFLCLLTAAAIGLTNGLAAATAMACPFCSSPSLTLSEQLSGAQAAVLVQWSSGKEAKRDEGFVGSTTYEILQVVRDESHQLKKGSTITLDRYRIAKPGDLFLLFGSVNEGQVEWSSPLEVTETSFNYVVQAPSKESPSVERLAYFLKFLEFPDQMIANDAYAEFSNAPYDDIVPLSSRMPREKLREWLANPNVTPTRIGLYGLMLGLCGQKDDAEFLKAEVLKETDTFRLGIDGVMAGYLLLTGNQGLEVIEQSKLSNSQVPFSETFAAMQALRFMWQYAKGRIPADDLRAAMRILLNRPNLADLVIVDLARWNDWSVMDRLMSMYSDDAYQVPSVKRAIVRFMLIAEKDPVPPSAEPPAHIAQAKANLALLREKDPKTVKAAERFFFD
ncbi:hypothetical protein [Planctomicrobium piriforme]|uniref:Uncharacterized protein n=1 Tax=Planctomicrobium piriforme TaxID=1576369 RepID=A0A1I3ENQ2_9PLAN|nr:hypothetical protein [Planctomicrobium piriforme]SFI00450.1 hypothetical protein SAMN05421753_104301 [Planctomicrobium piriforme]